MGSKKDKSGKSKTRVGGKHRGGKTVTSSNGTMFIAGCNQH